MFPKVQWAPLDVPLKRRLQTLSILGMCLIFVIGVPFTQYLLYKLLYSEYWWVAILYLMWMIYDIEVCNRGGRISNWVRNLPVWRYYCDYFPVKLVKTAELDPSKNYILGCFPHGVVTFGAFGAFGTNALDFYKTFPGLTVNMITLRERLIIPVLRELFLAWGGCSSSMQSLLYLLNPKKQKGKCVTLAVGGTAELLDTHPGEYNVKLRNRKGFVRVALMTGASLVPVLSFGETDLFRDFNYPEGTLMRRWHKWVSRVTGFIPVFPIGRGVFQYSFGILPYRRPITVVVGAPIHVERNLEPSTKEVDSLHATFMDKLTELFETEKAKYITNHENVKLVIG
ncbi:2-acylglycerol O-acyltransferase 2-like [Ostrinia furnacalis]|uniref:2-acylglycerol O-acyltransferase 2-like n=1 Tax=Ostrinia furnacalis TaxID=93504 RepID=UPI00103ED199|nr:2-acylglycerol O-acyltransferase 2-like [Ostrinia furnacalis]